MLVRAHGGSGLVAEEGPRRAESSDPLMLCISSKELERHEEAVTRLLKALRKAFKELLAGLLSCLRGHPGEGAP